VSFAGYAPLCTGVLVGTIVATILGVLALLALALHLAARFAARFPRAGRSVAFASMGISIQGDQLRDAKGEPFDLQPGDFQGLTVDADSTGQVVSLRETPVIVTPQRRWFRMPQARMQAPGQVLVGSEDGVLERSRLGRTGCIRHELTGSWAVSIEDASVADAPGGTSEVNATGTIWVLRDVRADDLRLPAIVERIRREAVGPTVQTVVRRVAAEHQESDRDGKFAGLVGRLRRESADEVTTTIYTPPVERKL
jgi:hypothetical protein